MGRKKGRCVFCGSAGKLTNEDVWPIWIVELVKSISADLLVTGAGGKKRRAGTIIDRARRVCRGCNGGWMSDLEREVIPFLKPMLLGKNYQTALSVQQRGALARWTYKTTLTSVLPRKERIVPLSAYREFYETRSIPASVSVWLAAYGDRTHALWSQPEGIPYSSGLGPVPGDGPVRTNEAYLYTFVLLRVALQVLGPVSGDPFPTGYPKTDLPILRLWPIDSSTAMLWPLYGHALDDALLERFATRRDFF